MVGHPANRRPFAIVKSLAHRYAKPDTTPEPEPKNMKNLLKSLFGTDEPDLATAVADLDDDDRDELREAVTKALGGDDAVLDFFGFEALAADDDDDDDDDALSQKALEALDTETRAYLKRMELTAKALTETVEGLTKQAQDDERASISKRAEVLKDAGWDIDPEKATREELDIVAKQAAAMKSTLVDLGVFKQIGSSEGEAAGDLAAAMTNEVEARLGRLPIDKAEDAKVRLQVFRDVPGLLEATRQERRDNAEA